MHFLYSIHKYLIKKLLLKVHHKKKLECFIRFQIKTPKRLLNGYAIFAPAHLQKFYFGCIHHPNSTFYFIELITFFIFFIFSLIAESELDGQASEPRAFASYSPHTLPVADLHLSSTTAGGALRVLTVSADHHAVLWSMATRQVKKIILLILKVFYFCFQILLRITADQPLSACCMDAAELRLFLASESGTIRAVDICTKVRWLL